MCGHYFSQNEYPMLTGASPPAAAAMEGRSSRRQSLLSSISQLENERQVPADEWTAVIRFQNTAFVTCERKALSTYTKYGPEQGCRGGIILGVSGSGKVSRLQFWRQLTENLLCPQAGGGGRDLCRGRGKTLAVRTDRCTTEEDPAAGDGTGELLNVSDCVAHGG